MANRPTPTTDELIEALPLGNPEEGICAVPWDFAEAVIKRQFKTTYAVAARWLMERVSEPNSPLVAMRSGARLVGPKVDGKYTSVLAPGWTEEVGMEAGFTQQGRPALGSDRNRVIGVPFVLLRTALEPLRLATIAARAERKAKQEEETRAARREFYGHHSEAMTVIEKWLSGLDRSGVHKALRGSELFRISNFKSAHDMWGGHGGLTIDLHGSEIAAFAALIEQTREGRA
jgi:hypothetical protein